MEPDLIICRPVDRLVTETDCTSWEIEKWKTDEKRHLYNLKSVTVHIIVSIFYIIEP